MTVQELIHILKPLDQSAEIVTIDVDYYGTKTPEVTECADGSYTL